MNYLELESKLLPFIKTRLNRKLENFKSQRDIAEAYGTSQTMVYKILSADNLLFYLNHLDLVNKMLYMDITMIDPDMYNIKSGDTIGVYIEEDNNIEIIPYGVVTRYVKDLDLYAIKPFDSDVTIYFNEDTIMLNNFVVIPKDEK